MDMHLPPKGLDALDLRLIAALVENARMTNRDLARLTGIAEPTCIQRRRRLEKLGVILGYTAVVAYEQLPAMFRVWFSVRLAGSSAAAARAFERLVASEPCVVSIYATGGPTDYFFEVRTFDYENTQALKARLEARRDIVAEVQIFPIYKQLATHAS